VLGHDDLDYLRKLSVFAALRDDVVATIGEHARRTDCAAGEVVFEEGTPAKEMVIVLDGKLEIVKQGRNGQEARIAVIGSGDVVGEMSLVDIQPRSAEVRAVTASSLVVLSHADIANVYRQHPASYALLVLNIAREISIRLRRMDSMLANLITEIDEVTGTRIRRVFDDE